MPSNHLTLRLTRDDVLLIEALRAHTGSSKSDLVKHALRMLASQPQFRAAIAPSLFSLGEGRFGRHGIAARQSADIKRVVRERLESRRRE